jgi:hypothetical protein
MTKRKRTNNDLHQTTDNTMTKRKRTNNDLHQTTDNTMTIVLSVV